MMTADDVSSVLAVLRNADVDVWIGGGWGIDALVGQQTRQHRKDQEPADHDRHDMAQLRQAFGIATHFWPVPRASCRRAAGHAAACLIAVLDAALVQPPGNSWETRS